ncbi:Group 1 glycosyl transferase (fragment) [Candidatus Promineifilum breve]|uniref:Group 1 glycosyl transferase n=1 Tax=Candidatus Promineifilum breve TaxID=1806508 RepID=A0A170PIM8_9CHLR
MRCGPNCAAATERPATHTMSGRVLHQFLTGATSGDAITDQALLMQRWLREAGFTSEIYAWHLHPSMEGAVRPLPTYHHTRGEAWAIYHHSIGSDVPDFLLRQAMRLILVYHNITPADYFTGSDPLRAHLARQGIEQLAVLRPITGLALAVSAYNEADLIAAGYEQTAVLPICLQAERYESAEPLPPVPGPRLLFIGRLAPNKRQEDLVKLLACLRRIRPTAHLTLLGDRWEIGYDRWVEGLAAEMSVGDGLTLTGKVSQAAMVAHLRAADLFVSMSEHEGFGVPLIESMVLGLPVLAYGAAAVPETMGGAGLLFHDKDYEALAELIDLLLDDPALRQRIIAGQRARARAFLEPAVRGQFIERLGEVGLC